jgi:histidinol-phosphate/aromatic aminotransferase/cobyric acid decarboxylase-like protein
VPSNEANGFKPSNQDYMNGDRSMAIFSNPCNPTGITRSGAELEDFVRRASASERGALIDEAYEFFHDEPVSSLQYVKDIDNTNIFVTGACTKGLQAPGIRIGWCIASKKNVEILGNFATIQTGGVSHLSQLYAI